MSLQEACICTWRMIRGCPRHCPAGPESIQDQLDRITRNEEKIMTALDNLQAADEALKAEVVTFLQDIATTLAAEDPDIQAVADDINAQVASLQGGDPAAASQSPAAPVTPPADGGSAS